MKGRDESIGTTDYSDPNRLSPSGSPSIIALTDKQWPIPLSNGPCLTFPRM